MAKRKPLTVALLLLVLVTGWEAPAFADRITIASTGAVFWPGFEAGDVLRVSFDMSQYDPPPAMDTLDVLTFRSFMHPLAPIGSFTVRVIDRGQLLGSYTAAFDATDTPTAYFRAPTSAFAAGNPTVIDFSTFADGTFDGSVELTIDSGAGNGGRLSEGLVLGHTLDALSFVNSGFSYPDQHSHWEVIPEVSPVPEPASLFLCGTGALGLLARIRRRRRSGSAVPPD